MGPQGPVGFNQWTVVNSVTSGNYIWCIKTDNQCVEKNIFVNILFTSFPIFKGWIIGESGDLICDQSGIYTVTYNVNVIIKNDDDNEEVPNASIRCTIDDIEIIGSAKTIEIYNKVGNFTNTFIIKIDADQKLNLQFTGSNEDIQINQIPSVFGEAQSLASLVITRIV